MAPVRHRGHLMSVGCLVVLGVSLTLPHCEPGYIDAGYDTNPPDGDADSDGDGDGDSDVDGDADGDGDSVVIETMTNVIDRAFEARCECLFAAYGYASPAECTEDSTTTPRVRGCLVETYLNHYDAVVDHYTCRLPAEEAYLSCLEAASCVSETVTICIDELNAAVESCPGVGEEALAAFNNELSVCANGPLSGCPDVPNLIGLEQLNGSTDGQGDDLGGSCGGAQGADVSHRWTAPSAGIFTIDTQGSSFDTVLYVSSACTEGEELVCNDDVDLATGNRASSVELELIAGQVVVIVVDGVALDKGGEYTLNFQAR